MQKTSLTFLFILLSIFFFQPLVYSENPIGSDCTYKGIKLHGKVKVVTNFPDIKVQKVTNFPDLKVQMVTNFPDSCGQWQLVENFEDFKIQYVDNFPDIKIQLVTNFPGVQ